MSNSGKIWDVKEVYKKIRDDNWSRGDIGVSSDSISATFTSQIFPELDIIVNLRDHH